MSSRLFPQVWIILETGSDQLTDDDWFASLYSLFSELDTEILFISGCTLNEAITDSLLQVSFLISFSYLISVFSCDIYDIKTNKLIIYNMYLVTEYLWILLISDSFLTVSSYSAEIQIIIVVYNLIPVQHHIFIIFDLMKILNILNLFFQTKRRFKTFY